MRLQNSSCADADRRDMIAARGRGGGGAAGVQHSAEARPVGGHHGQTPGQVHTPRVRGTS